MHHQFKKIFYNYYDSSGKVIFLLADAARLYIDQIELELWPASSLTCSLGLILISSDILVCLNQCTVAERKRSASSTNCWLQSCWITSSKQISDPTYMHLLNPEYFFGRNLSLVRPYGVLERSRSSVSWI